MRLRTQAIFSSADLAKHGNDDQFRMLLEWLPDAVLVHIGDEIVYVNPFCVKLLAAQGPEQLIGRSIREIIGSDHLSPIKDLSRDCYASGKASPPTESTLIALDGSLVQIEGVAIPVFWNGSFAIEVVLRDIRERKIAERMAEEWQKRLALAQQAGLRIGLWDWDTATNTVSWSDENYRQFGFTRETFSGNVCDAVPRVHPQDLPRVKKAIQGTLSGNGEYSAQYRIVRPDGSNCWVDARGVMVEGSTHMIGISIDITHLKSTEQSLRESEEKYRNLFENAAHGIFRARADGSLLDVNPAIVTMLGYTSKDELLACNLDQDIYEDPDAWSLMLEGCSPTGRVESVEARWKRKDGTIIDVHMSGRQVQKQDGSAGHYEVIVEDFTERRKLQAGLEAERLRVVQVTMRTVHDIVNNCLNQLQLLRLDAEDKVPLESLMLFDQAIQETSMKLNAMGELQGYAEMQMAIGTGLDTKGASFENLEGQIRQTQKMEAVGLLAGGIAHDFNNLLGIILANAELLLETAHSSTQGRYVEQIQKAGLRSAQLTRQLLAFSRKQVLRPTLLDLNEVVNDVGILQRLIGEDVEVVTDLEEGLGSIRADRGQMEQILMNLATNARDAMPTGGKFTIRTRNAELSAADTSRYAYIRSGPYVLLSASDTGLGMNPDVQERVFEPFFTTKAKGRGTGLGLATVYGIVKDSGGYIWIRSTPGAGSTFDIYLPRVSGKALPQAGNLKESQSNCPRGTETILVVEDDDALRQITCECLAASGYDVLQAASSNCALEIAGKHKGLISLMITDVVLPDMNGPSVAAKVCVLHSETQVLYVSGYTDAPMAQRLTSEGAILMQKPVSRKALLETIDGMLHHRARRAS